MLGKSCFDTYEWLKHLPKSLLPVSEDFLLLWKAHDQGAHGNNGHFGVKDTTQGDLRKGVHEEQAGLQIKFLVLGNNLEEFEVKHVEGRSVILWNLDLFKQGFT